MKFEYYYGKNEEDSRHSFFCYYENLCKEGFSFLKEAYCFQFIETRMLGNLYIACEFKNTTTGILFDYDRREGFHARVIELKNNEIGFYDQRWHYVDELLTESTGPHQLLEEDSSSIESGYLETTLNYNIYILKQYGDAVLRGDFTVFKK